MFPRNPASRRTRTSVRLLTTALAALLGSQESSGVAARSAPDQPASPRAAPAQPVARPSAFLHVHGARPLPPARPGERTAFTLQTRAGEQHLTLRQLQALPTVRYATRHLQLGRTVTYEGVPLRDLAARGGFLGRDVRVSASNGFAATIRAADYLHEPIMLAYRADGRPIPVLDKGPLTVVLPPGPARFTSPPYASAWVWFAVGLAPVP